MRPIGAALVVGIVLGACGKGTPEDKKAAPPERTANAPAKAEGADLTARLQALQKEIAASEASLGERYRAMEARRKALPAGDNTALAEYNRDAAAYTAARQALTNRQTEAQQLQVREAEARKGQAEIERPASELLIRLRAAIVANDFALQAKLMREALTKHRERATFAEISKVARPQLDRVDLAMLQRVAANAGARPAAPNSAVASSPAGASASLAALRALINSPVQPVARGEGRTGELDFHPNPGLPPLNYAGVTKAQLWAERKTYAYDSIRPKRHPQLWYRSEDIEFNLLLKPYYNDQTLPTKRLSEAEYDRIVELCRQIAKESGETAPSLPAATAATSAAPALDPAKVWPLFQALKQDWPR